MFKRCLAIVLLVALTASSFQRYFIYAGFELNRDYIAKNLCINRKRPQLHCNGRCYFMRKIKAAQENEKKQAEKDALNRIEVSFSQEPVRILFASPITAELPEAMLPVYQCLYNFSYTTSLLQPPRANA
jgi:hypothetical protein